MRPYPRPRPQPETRVHDAVYKALYSLPETIEALVRVVAPRLAADMHFARLAGGRMSAAPAPEG